jgi:hypothetical protein
VFHGHLPRTDEVRYLCDELPATRGLRFRKQVPPASQINLNMIGLRRILVLSCTLAIAAATGITGKSLRILPLGDSITVGKRVDIRREAVTNNEQYGYLSADGNGYRKYLQTDIKNAGAQVTFVGSVKSGDMTNNDNEGTTRDQLSRSVSSFTN